MNEQVVDFLSIVEVFDTDEVETMERLKAVYFGLLSLAAGSILFKITCPREILDFSDKYEFSEKEWQLATPVGASHKQLAIKNRGATAKFFETNDERTKINRVVNRDIPEAKLTELTAPSHIRELSNQSLEAYRSTHGILLVEILEVYFEVKNRSAPVARILCFTAFTYGFCQLSAPAVMIAIKLLVL